VVTRGAVWWVDFGDPVGSSPGYRRPAVVVSSDRFNRSRINTVIVAAITSNTRLSREPGNVTLPDALLPKPSVVNVTALFTVDREQLVDHLADLPALEARSLDEGLRLVLGLGSS
jgi:mRNA interferase MazF